MNLAQLATLNRQLRSLVLMISNLENQKDTGSRLISSGQVAVFEDVYMHSPTTVQDITRRTKLAQSYVSKTVAHMKQKGVVKLRQSQADRRKTIITFNPAMTGFVQSMSKLPIHRALQQTLPGKSDEDITRAETLLDEVATLFGVSE